MMKPILCFGELLIDFLNVNTTEEGGFRLPEFRQYPGGAPANVAAAIGRLGGPARFLGQAGNDRFGRFLKDAMVAMNVDMRYLQVHPTAHTPLAFVSLDDSGERSFDFLREGTADLVMTKADFPGRVFDGVGVFHFCSNTLTDDRIAMTTWYAIQFARQAGATISFDVNLRHNLWPAGRVNPDVIKQFIGMADWVKVSREELDWVEARGYPMTAWLTSVEAVWVTDGAGDIQVARKSGGLTVKPPRVSAVDTTAGGDAFTGGLLLALNQAGMDILSDGDVRRATEFAAACGAMAVSRPGALPALPTWSEVSAKWPSSDAPAAIE